MKDQGNKLEHQPKQDAYIDDDNDNNRNKVTNYGIIEEIHGRSTMEF
jgi:hypothetical protein